MNRFLIQFIVLISVGLLSACTSYTKPRVLASRFSAHRAASQRYTLGIERTQQPEHAFITTDDLISAARQRGIFKRVDYTDRLPSPPDVVLRDFCYSRVEKYSYPNYLFFYSLGVFPDDRHFVHSISFTVSGSNGSVMHQANESRRDMKIVGWIAPIMLLFPGWSTTEDKPAHADYVIAQILAALPPEH